MTETFTTDQPTPPSPRRGPSRTKVAVLATSGALVLATGIGVTTMAMADPTPTPTPPSGSSTSGPADPGKGGPGHRGGPRGELGGQLATKLAAKLGIDEAKVTAALKEIGEAGRPDPSATPDPNATPDPSKRPDPAAARAELAKELADKLGIDVAKVSTALEEIDNEATAARKQAFTAKLDAAVKAGTITQSEADAVLKAAEAGVIGMGGGPR